VATRRGGSEVAMEHFTLAIERIVAGLEKKNRLLNPMERNVVAHHELGHAFVAAALSADKVHKVSIIPRGIGALGYTIQRPTDDRYLMTRAELEAKMAVLLGGRAAEDVAFNELSTGAADDLGKATNIARSMVTRYGMVPELGHATYDREPSPFLNGAAAGFEGRSYSEETAREIDCAVREMLDKSYAMAHGVISENQDVLAEGAQRLLEVETLTETDLQYFFDKLRPASPMPTNAAI
jgi:cell division protease FtsH